MFKTLKLDDAIEQFNKKIDPDGERNLSDAHFKTEDFCCKIDYFCNANGIAYGDWDMRFKDDIQMISQHELGYNFLWFNTGDTLAISNGKKFDEFGNGYALLGRTNQGFESISRFYGGKNYRAQCILISDELANQLEIFDHFDEMDSKFNNFKIDMVAKFTLNELRNAQIYKGKLKEIFIESKILDLIYKHSRDVENLKLNLNNKGGVKFDEHDMAANKKAREILFLDLTNPPSIKMLAKSCAINEFKLKKGFKMMFGTTIYGALQEKRLKIAYELLMQRDINISEAAAFVGYKSISHFSNIFHKFLDNHQTKLQK